MNQHVLHCKQIVMSMSFLFVVSYYSHQISAVQCTYVLVYCKQYKYSIIYNKRFDPRHFLFILLTDFSRSRHPSSCISVSCPLSFFSYVSISIEAQADLALDCYLTVSQKLIPKHVLLTYRRQFRVDGCPRDAVV